MPFYSKNSLHSLFNLKIPEVKVHFLNLKKKLYTSCNCRRDSSPKMEILSSFTHPQVVPNLYEFLSSAEHTNNVIKYITLGVVHGISA